MSEFHSIIYYFKKHLLSIYYAPGTILDIRVRKADMIPVQMGVAIPVGQTARKQINQDKHWKLQ